MESVSSTAGSGLPLQYPCSRRSYQLDPDVLGRDSGHKEDECEDLHGGGEDPETLPCVEINGLHIGSCDYDADHLLNLADPILCPDHFPDGQVCALPLMPGVYGGGDPLVIGPLDDIPDSILPFLKGVIYAEATLTSAAGDKLACIWV